MNATSSLDANKSAFFPGPVPLYYWILSAINGVITVACNVLVISIVTRKRRLRRSKSNWLLLSLALSDLAVGIIMIPSIFTCYFSPHLACDWDLNKQIYDVFLYISVTNLCVITADRYIAVTLPLRHVTIITPKSTVRFLVAAWTAPVLVSLVPFVLSFSAAPSQTKVLVDRIFIAIKIGLFEIIPCVLMILAYVHIFQISRRHHVHINSMRKIVTSRTCPAGSRPPRARSTIKVFCVVVPLFILCWTLASWREICSSIISCKVPHEVVHISRLLLKGHSMINPIVYALQKKDIRRELRRAACCTSKRYRLKKQTTAEYELAEKRRSHNKVAVH